MNSIAMKTPFARIFSATVALALALVLSACGGSGAGAGGNAITATTKASALSLLSSESSLDSDGRTTAEITAVVKTEQNVALSGQAVQFSTVDPGATLEVTSAITDAAGRATANLSITDKAVRDIVVSAALGDIAGSITVPVVGTSLSVSGSNNIVFNAPTEYSVSLRDSGGAPISSAQVTVSSANGNTVSPSTLSTDAQGQARFDVTGTVAGADTLTASAQGVSATFAASVSGTQLAYSTPALNAEVEVNTPTNVTVQLVQSGSPLTGQSIQFAATRGTFVGANTAVTDGSGVATVQIQSTSSGVSTITATSPAGVTSTRQIEFISSQHSKISVQPSPAVVGANIDASGTNSSQLIAVVKDANDNPVKGVRVDFSLVNDPSNGRVEPSFGITDSFGTATASFVAGPNPTGPDQVQIRASVSAAPAITADNTLTVSELELSVEMATGNDIESADNDTTYVMPWAAFVTDSSGNPVPNAQVTVAIEPARFRKGRWTPGADGWEQTITVVCPNEDTNLNRTLDAGEDTDNDAQLEPGGQATVFVTSENGVTAADGVAQFEVKYGQSAGVWTEVRLRATITTASGATEGDTEQTFWLPVLAADVSDTNTSPPGATAPISPYGETNDCSDPN